MSGNNDATAPLIRVLLADDQPLLVGALTTILNAAQDVEVVATAGDGIDALDAADRYRIDVAVLDIRMPRLDGIETTRRLKSRPRPPRVLQLTTFNDDQLVRRALEAGADGFLLKDAEPEELLDAIRLVYRGESVLSSGVTGHLVRAYRDAIASSGGGLDADARAGLALLTPRELETLRVVADGATNAEIAQRFVIGESTVKTHVSSLLAKLHARDRVALVVLAHKAGLAGAVPPPVDGEN